MKKTLAILIAVLLVFGSFCGAFAGSVSGTERKEKPEPLKEVYSGTCGANLTWTLDSETGVLEITGTGDMDNWTYYSYSPWHSYNTDFKTVLIGEGVTSIGDYAFYFCREIISVDIPGSVTSIGEGAFCDCVSLAYVIIPDGVTSIGAWAFYNCTSLAYATIPGSVTSIGESAFIDCTSLAAAAFLGEPPSSFDTHVFDGCAVDFCIHCTEDYASCWAPNGETEWNGYPIVMQLSSAEALVCGNDLIAYFDFLTGELRIEGSGDMYDYDDDEHVPWRYYKPGILSVTIENGATGIGDHAFSNSALLTAVTIPDSVTSIGDWAFYNCSSLTSVTIPDSVTSIGYAAFYYCSSLTSVTIPDSVTSIGYYSFQSCEALTSVSIGSGVTSIGESAFEGCAALASVTIGSGVTSIGEYAFEGCAALTSINIPCGVTDIGMQALSNCSSLAAITVDPNNQTYSSVDGVLFNKEQTELICCPGGKTGDYTVPDGVWKIDVFAFRGCSLLTSVTFPESVTWIGGDGAFEGCSSLSSATFCGEAPSYFGTDAFSGCAPGFYICYYPGYTYSWSPNGETEWNGYPIMVLWDAPFVCGDDLRAYFDPMTGELRIEGSGYMYDYYEPEQTPWYCYRNYIQSVTIENGATWIGCYAFYECSWLSSVVIPESVVHIGEHAFANCGSLTSMTFPDSVSSIGEYAFENCGALASVAFGGNLWSISDHAFENCYSLTSVTIPESVSSIGESAFENCGALAALTLGSSVTSIGARAFHYCGSLTSVTFPSSVWSMGEEAFSGCYSLASVTFCAEPPSSFGSYLFSGADPEFCIYYYPEYTYAWSPNGETEWEGYPIAMYLAEASFVCGNHLVAYFDPASGELRIEGSGNMYNYGDPEYEPEYERTPWYGYKDYILSVTIESGATSIGRYAFADCELLSSVIIPESVARIGVYAFAGCDALTSVTIPDGVTSIGGCAFIACEALTSVTIPASVTSIDSLAFGYCYSLTSVTFCGEVPSSCSTSLFDECPADLCIYYYAEYAYSWSPNGETEWNGYPIRMIGGTVAEPGDLDGDGVISMSDVTTLSMFLNGENPQISSSGLQAADANGDGTVDIRDIAAIYQKIAQS